MKTAHRPFLAKKKSKENKKERARNSNNKTKKIASLSLGSGVNVYRCLYGRIHACLSTVELGGFFESSVALRVDKSPNGWRWKEDEEE